MGSMTTSDVRQKNKESILQYIYTEKCTHQQLICETLQLSRPTVIPILREYEEAGFIAKNGFFESTGGRKANAITFVPDSRIALGVELLADSYEITALNLYGEIICTALHQRSFQNHDDYYQHVCSTVNVFIEQNRLLPQRILGIGIVLQGLISSDGTSVTYGKILDCTGLNISSFTEHLPYPCKFFHDAEAAAQAELWQSPNHINMIYMNIRNHVSGAIIVNREFLQGRELKSGVFEHMSLVPDGRTCYCGRKGCMETYCSTQPFLDIAGSLDNFFSCLRANDSECMNCWYYYLQYLASAINNLRMFIDYSVIIGGTLAPYLQKSDILLLHQLVADKTAFPTNKEFIRPSKCLESAISRGAALPYIKEHLKLIMGLSAI